ncbi:MAG TPA: undecaprenyl-diphosphatase UppP [Candidatus Kapabacteria bacterium]|nr:undecaprenyl-diphosphatase UppP [Candidatus Kapabacteria bacterium]
MTIVQAIVLGLIQGLSEFLPISSTAHLTLVGRAMGLIDPTRPERWTEFIAIVQLGTLVAVLVYFSRDIVAIVGAFVRENLRRVPVREQTFESRSGWMIALGTIPIVIIGLAFKDVIEGALTKNLVVIGTSLVVLAILLEIAERVARFNRPIEQLTPRDAVFIGAAQAIALIPGSSRSGTTLTAGLFAGLTREAAARFSFLLSIPAIAASGLLEFFKVVGHLDGAGTLTLVVATAVSAVSGYASIAFLLRYLRTHSTRLFIAYRLLLGGGILIAVAVGWLGA